MSRPILSRPRTRVYGCNYDKGESYYKPMVDHLDRKYSGRPLFPESRNSFADEVAARRSDIGSRNLAGTRDETLDDDIDYLYDCHGRANPDDDIEDDFVSVQRRFKQRASDAFEEDLAELRRRRRDLQDRLFDMVDVDAEISKAKTTLDNANVAFLKHATKFDNNELAEIEPDNLVAKLEKTRKIKKMIEHNGELNSNEAAIDTGKSKKVSLFKWSKFAEMDNEMPKLIGNMTKARIRDEVDVIPDISMMLPIKSDINKQKQSSERRRSKKRSVIKRKKTVTF